MIKARIAAATLSIGVAVCAGTGVASAYPAGTNVGSAEAADGAAGSAYNLGAGSAIPAGSGLVGSSTPPAGVFNGSSLGSMYLQYGTGQTSLGEELARIVCELTGRGSGGYSPASNPWMGVGCIA